jgi:dethiobiotin synthetase
MPSRIVMQQIHLAVKQPAIKVKIAGWIANCIDPNMKNFTENLQTLTQRIGEPIAIVKHNGAIDAELIQQQAWWRQGQLLKS